MSVHELAVGDHSQFKVRESSELHSWLSDSRAALMWSYASGSFDPHPGWVALFSSRNVSVQDLNSMRELLSKILHSRDSDFRHGDMVDGCTVFFSPPKTAFPHCILIFMGEADLITKLGLEKLHKKVIAEAEA